MVEDKGMISPWLPSKAVIHLGQGHSPPKCLSVAIHMRNCCSAHAGGLFFKKECRFAGIKNLSLNIAR